MARLKLTADNYYSQEANMAYMSASQFKSFRQCESAALAELRGEWKRPSTTALLVGSYVDAYFSDELEQFKAEHPEIFNKDGTLKADYKKAQAICERLNQDELARLLLSGKHQAIKTGEIAGVAYKAKYDSLLTARQVEAICKKYPEIRDLVPFGGAMIVDLKCMKDFEPMWDEDAGEKVSFAEYWGYDIQGAIYQHLDGRHAPFVLVVATKEAETDIDAFYIPDEDLAFSLSEVEALSPRYAAIKRGEIEPEGCGKCAYCRSTKRLSGIKHYKSITDAGEFI
jgi:hypothetical protein